MLADIEDSNAFSFAVQRHCDLLAMLAACIVIVGQDHDIGAAQELRVFAPSLDSAPAAWIRCRDKTKGTKAIDISLALGDVDTLASGNSLDKSRQPVEDAPRLFEGLFLLAVGVVRVLVRVELAPVLTWRGAHVFASFQAPNAATVFVQAILKKPLGLCVESNNSVQEIANLILVFVVLALPLPRKVHHSGRPG